MLTKKWFIGCISFLIFSSTVLADEGMWLLSGLKQNNEARMKELGLKISAEQIVDSLSQAIISFNGSGTASFISADGLVLTNYHCAYDGLQQSSSEEHNYLRDGFWAHSRKEEIPLKGCRLTINRKILDISKEVNDYLQAKRGAGKSNYQLTREVVARYQRKFPGLQVSVRSYRNNTLHILYVIQAFEDVRLVGAPPYEIAKFGGETDNWTWPRHGCDFAYLRVYVSPDGKGRPYHPQNVVYHPDVYLKVSDKGFDKGSFAMSIGYPGYTDRNATSAEIWEKRQVLNPAMIKVRTTRQDILQSFMAQDEAIRIKYAAKYAASANYCKNAVGMNEWIDRLDICQKKKAEEQALTASGSTTDQKNHYAQMFQAIEDGIQEAAPYNSALSYYNEIFNNGCEMLNFINAFGRTIPQVQQKDNELRKNLIVNTKLYYKDYDEKVDCAVTKALIRVLKENVRTDLLPDFFHEIDANYGGDTDRFVDEMYRKSVFANQEKVLNSIADKQYDITQDMAFRVAKQISDQQKMLFKRLDEKKSKARRALREYTQILPAYHAKNYYPNADKTIRLSFGTVCDLSLPDGTKKPFQTMLSGVIAKEQPDNPDFQLPEKLKSLWEQKDFGSYGNNGDVPADFITNGDVTGGNSGSPMLNAQGELMGLVFDCNWESMTRDFNYDQNLHRVICLDVRYLLFITEKYAGMKNIVDEILKN